MQLFFTAALGLALSLLCFAGQADAQAATPGTPMQLKFQFSGQTRSYVVYVPKSLARTSSRPAVLLLHGNGGSGIGMMGQSRLNPVAEAEGFVAVYPETPMGRAWSDGRPNKGNYDDVGYILRVVDELALHNGVDPSRIYIGGNSSGGFMAHRLACEVPSSFLAVGVVSALLTEVLAPTCATSESLPMVYFSGTADPVVPFGGANWVRSQPATRDFWMNLGDCTHTTGPVAQADQYDDGTKVSLERVDQCAASGMRLDFYVIEGGGHTWPGARGSGSRNDGLVSQEIDATHAMVSFFIDHGL